MAGVVAVTLRRRTLRQKLLEDAKYQDLEPGHISLSPAHSPTKSLSRSPSGRVTVKQRPLKAALLHYQDFWPTCINPDEKNLMALRFETFDTLIPKANSWLNDTQDIGLHMLKCESVEKKVTAVDQVEEDRTMFTPRGPYAIYVKGLRLWYVCDKNSSSTGANATAAKPAQESVTSIEIGYMNVIPKCLDSSGKYPVYENMADTHEAINSYLRESPIEGKILTIETVPLKLPRRQWRGPEVDPDQTYFPDEYLRHVLYITRIYFIYGTPEEKFIGAQDFLPNFLRAPKWYAVYGIYPKYHPLVTAMHSAKNWIASSKNIRVTNIQTLEAVYKTPENVVTGINFVDKVESCALVRFVRVSYVKPVDGSTEKLIYASPPGFSYKTFIPATIKVGMCSGTPEYESLRASWARSKAWLKYVDHGVIGVETTVHPVNLIWSNQDRAETTVMQGEWTTRHRGERRRKNRRQLVQVIRVYLDGDYTEPPIEHLPPAPTVEEVNDCHCTIL